MNVTLLEQAKHSIMADPEFDMSDWEHCIGNHICRLGGMTQHVGERGVEFDGAHAAHQTMKLLGISWDTMGKLCAYQNWPVQLRTSPRDRVGAIRRIALFIATNGTDQESKEEIPEAAIETVEEQELVGV